MIGYHLNPIFSCDSLEQIKFLSRARNELPSTAPLVLHSPFSFSLP